MFIPQLTSRLALVFLATLVSAAPLKAAVAQPTTDQLKSWVDIRQQRVDLLRDEIKQDNARIESRLDAIIETLTSISDSKDSRSRVARMKEDTQKKLMKTINYYDQKRAALKEEMRNPRLQLTAEEKQKFITAFDALIEKRAQQILALNKSMPTPKDYDRYENSWNGWYGTNDEQETEYNQNVRMTSRSNTQRTAILKQLDASLERLDRQERTLKTQLAATTDPAQQKALGAELAKTDALIAERRQQRLETLKPTGGTQTHTVALKEAMDLDKALQTAVADLNRDFTTLFQRYNTFIQELSSLHATESALEKATAH